MSFHILSPILRRNCSFLRKITKNPKRLFKSNPEPVIEKKNDEPIKYSTSKASTWKAKYSNSGENYDNVPKVQGLIVVTSLTSFMVYFCILREENDLDDYIRHTEKKVPLLVQESQIRIDIKEKQKSKLDTSSAQKRLEEVLKMKAELDAAENESRVKL